MKKKIILAIVSIILIIGIIIAVVLIHQKNEDDFNRKLIQSALENASKSKEYAEIYRSLK